jgi:hypothetical protein
MIMMRCVANVSYDYEKLMFLKQSLCCQFNVNVWRGGPTAWGLGEGPTTPHRKRLSRHEIPQVASELSGSFEHVKESSGYIKGGGIS